MTRYTLTKTPLCISNTDTKKEQIHTRYPYYFCSIFGASKNNIENNKGNKGTWWRHQMETFSALLAICAWNSPVPGEFPAQSPVTRSLDIFFDLHPNKRLCKQWWGWWFETPSCPLWRHRNEMVDMMTHRMCWKRPLSDCWCVMHIVTNCICAVYDSASQDPILLRQIGQNNTEIMAWTSKYINRNIWDVIHHLWPNFSQGLAKLLPK